MPLTEERVREIAGNAFGAEPTYGEAEILATDWLRFHAERVATGAEGTSFAWPEHCAAITADRDALRQQVKDAEAERDQWKRTAHEALEPLPICKCGDHFDNESLCWGCVADECNATESALRQQNAALRAMVEEAYREGCEVGYARFNPGVPALWKKSSVAARLAALGEP